MLAAVARWTWGLWALTLGVVACKDAPGKADAGPPPVELPRSPFEVRIDGRPVALKTVRVHQSEGSALHIFFSDADVPCSDIVARTRVVRPGETQWGTVTVAPAWHGPSEDRWRVIRISRSIGSNHGPDFGPAQLLGKPGDDELRLRVDASADGLSARGEIVAKRCAPGTHHAVAPQPGMRMTCGSRPVALNSALLLAGDDGELELGLGTSGRTCEPHEGMAVFEDLAISIPLSKPGANGARRVSPPHFWGTALRGQVGAERSPAFGAEGPLLGEGGPLRIHLKGRADLGVCELVYEGFVDATRCATETPTTATSASAASASAEPAASTSAGPAAP